MTLIVHFGHHKRPFRSRFRIEGHFADQNPFSIEIELQQDVFAVFAFQINADVPFLFYKGCLLLVFFSSLFLPLGGHLSICFDLERLSADAQIEK